MKVTWQAATAVMLSTHRPASLSVSPSCPLSFFSGVLCTSWFSCRCINLTAHCAPPHSFPNLLQVLLRPPGRSACGPAPGHLVQSEWQSWALGQEWQPVGEMVDQQAHAAQPHRRLRHHRIPGRGTLQQSHGDCRVRILWVAFSSTSGPHCAN